MKIPFETPNRPSKHLLALAILITLLAYLSHPDLLRACSTKYIYKTVSSSIDNSKTAHLFGPEDLKNGKIASDFTPSHQDGLIICEPVVSKSATLISNFTSGCGDWLNFSVGGAPELGATPMWYSESRAIWELHRSDLQIDLTQAGGLEDSTGVDLVAVGTADGNANAVTITYQVYHLPNLNAVGDPISITGSETEIAADLGAIADRFKSTLGVVSTIPTPASGLTPSQLELCGRIRWLNIYASEPDQALLQQAAATSPYAAMLCLSRVRLNTLFSSSVLAHQQLINKVGENATALGQVEYVENYGFTGFQSIVDTSIAEHPFNLQLNICKMFVDQENGDFADKLDRAKAAVKSAPDNADALDNLCYAYSEVYLRYRKARYHSEMTTAETAEADRYLPYWLGYAEEAVKADPEDAHAWFRVAESAAYADKREETVGSLSMAIDLGTPDDKDDAYELALQICEQRWFNDTSLRDDYVSALIEDPVISADQLLYAISRLVDPRDKTRREQIIAAAIDRAKSEAVKFATDPVPYVVLGKAYKATHQYPLSVEAYAKASSLKPSDYFIHYEYATALANNGQYSQAVGEYDKAIRLSPIYPSAYVFRGLCYVSLHNNQAAISSFKSALSQDSQSVSAYAGLADVYSLMNNFQASEAAARAGLKLKPRNSLCWGSLIDALDTEHKYSEAIALGKIARSYGNLTYNAVILDDLADCYTHLGNPKQSIALLLACLKIDPDQCTHENLGEAYIALGRRAAAKQEWEEVVRSGDKDYLTVAEGNLTKYKMIKQ